MTTACRTEVSIDTLSPQSPSKKLLLVERNGMFQAISWLRSYVSFVKAKVTSCDKRCSNRGPAEKHVANLRLEGDRYSACLQGKGPRTVSGQGFCTPFTTRGRCSHRHVSQPRLGRPRLSNLVFNSLVPSDNEFIIPSYLSVEFCTVAITESQRP